MKFLNIILGAALVAGVGCTTPVMKAVSPVSNSETKALGIESPVSQPVLLPTLDAVGKTVEAKRGEIALTIRWPERPRTTQAIPNSANTIRVRIYQEGQSDLYNELIARPLVNEMNPDWGKVQTVSKTYCLNNGTYNVEVKAYAETAANLTGSSLAIASTQPAPSVTIAGQAHNVAIRLTPLYIPVLHSKSYAAGPTGQFVVTGSGFGTDANQIKAVCKYGNESWQPSVVDVVSVSDNALTLKMPSNAGTLILTRDGIPATGSVTLEPINNITLDTSIFKSVTTNLQYSPWQVTKLYAVTGATFSLDPMCTNSQGGQATNATWSLQVKDLNSNTDITSSVYSNGIFTLPADRHRYQITYISGNAQTQTVDLYAMGVSPISNPSTALTVVPYPNGLPGITSASNSFDLSQFKLLDQDDNEILLDRNDFNWAYSTKNRVKLDTNGDPKIANFLPYSSSVVAGPITITGTLKYDSSKKIELPINVMHLKSASFMYYNRSTSTWMNVPSGGIPMTYNAFSPYYNTCELRVKNITLTNGSSDVTYSAPYDQWGNLSGSFPLNIISSDEEKLSTAGNALTCVAPGAVTVAVRHSDELNVTLANISVNIQ